MPPEKGVPDYPLDGRAYVFVMYCVIQCFGRIVLAVARRMSWTTFSAGSFNVRVCCLIFAPVNVTMSQKLSLIQSTRSVQ